MSAVPLSLLAMYLALALVARRRGPDLDAPAGAGGGGRRPPRRRPVVAVVPANGSPAVQGLVSRLIDHVDRVVVVHAHRGGAPELSDVRGHPRIDVLAAPDGYRHPMARARCAGVRHALVHHGPYAVLVVEPDAGEAVELVPEFVAELAGHDAVLGDRSRAAGSMPAPRRLAARVLARVLTALWRRAVPDARSGVRLFSAEALQRVPLDPEGWASDVRHLRAMLAHGLDVVWLPVRPSADEVLDAAPERRDLVRWGPIFAGSVSVIALLAILSAVGPAVGLSAVEADGLGPVSTGAWIWAVASAAIAFFVGGLVAAMRPAAGGRERGLLSGLLAGATAITATLLLVGFGAGSLLGAGAGALGDVVDVARQIDAGKEAHAATSAVARAHSSAWGGFVGLALAVVLAGLGGLLGARGHAIRSPHRR